MEYLRALLAGCAPYSVGEFLALHPDDQAAWTGAWALLQSFRAGEDIARLENVPIFLARRSVLYWGDGIAANVMIGALHAEAARGLAPMPP